MSEKVRLDPYRAFESKIQTRSGLELQSVELLAPGEARVTAKSSWSLLRRMAVLFGDMANQAGWRSAGGQSERWKKDPAKNPLVNDPMTHGNHAKGDGCHHANARIACKALSR